MRGAVVALALVCACSSNVSGPPDEQEPVMDDDPVVDDDPPPGPVCGEIDRTVRTVYVSGAGGIQRFDFDPESATLTLRDTVTVAGGGNPSFLAFSPTKSVVYAADEGNGRVLAYAIADSGALSPLNDVNAQGGPAHVAVDGGGQHVFIANFGAGTVHAFDVAANGSLSASQQTVTLSFGAHQVALHPSKNVAYVPVRDNGCVYVFDVASGRLTNQREIAVADDPGPRHVLVHPTLAVAYLINEFSGTVIAYAVNADGSLGTGATAVNLLETPIPNASAAELQLSPNGKFLYGSVRGTSNVIAVLSVAADGALTRLANVSAHGMKPRHFSVDPSGHWMFVANQDSDDVSVFAVDCETGALTYRTTVTTGDQPQFVMMRP